MPGPANTRERIVMAALRIIGTVGVAGLTNRRIAAEAGLSLGSITYHFDTQDDLLRAGLLTFIAEESRRFTELADRFQAGEIGLEQAGALLGSIATDTSFGVDHTAWFELYLQAGREPELHEAANACFAAYDRLATSVLQAMGVPAAADFAEMSVALLTGMQLRRLATGSNPDRLVEALTRFVRTISTKD
ncbi:TetR/AcrR family transcriptional regulator [Nocardia sp. NPDC060256]|uniref:TetR/AcrR family transcriptional regulator n=1 Tax=unclassified Nocardia TaxID=2637762 RepID=UPI0036583769